MAILKRKPKTRTSLYLGERDRETIEKLMLQYDIPMAEVIRRAVKHFDEYVSKLGKR